VGGGRSRSFSDLQPIIPDGGSGIDLWKETIMAAASDGKRKSLKGTEALNRNRWKKRDVWIQCSQRPSSRHQQQLSYRHNEYSPCSVYASQIRAGIWFPNTTIVSTDEQLYNNSSKHELHLDNIETSQKTHRVSIKKTNQLILFRKIIVVYSHNHMKCHA
jgi:hypothetical protein